jgi:hypothetical protein
MEQFKTQKPRLVPWYDVKSFINNRFLVILLTLIVISRGLLIFIGPLVTTDLQRSLWYGKQFWDVFFDVYILTPLEIDPNFNIRDPTTGLLAWPDNTFDYGVVTLFFHAIIALIPLDTTLLVIITKLVFNVVDFINFFMLRRLENEEKYLSWLYLIILIPFSSLEGQPVSFTIFFLLSSILLYKEMENVSFAFIFLAIGFHWKYVSLLLLPYLFLDWAKRSIKGNYKSKEAWIIFIKPIIVFSIVFVALCFPLLFSPYILSYISFGGNLPVLSYPWNPFYLGFPFTISSFLLLLVLIMVLLPWLKLALNRSYEELWDAVGLIPLVGLWIFLLIYRYAFPWYWTWSFALFVIIPSNKRKTIVSFLLICIVAFIEFIYWTVIYNGIIQF